MQANLQHAITSCLGASKQTGLSWSVREGSRRRGGGTPAVSQRIARQTSDLHQTDGVSVTLHV